MKTIQERLLKALQGTTRFKCAYESGVSLSTVENVVGGRKPSQATEEKLNQWIEQRKESTK